jgi:glucose/arabinose dehydrogenase
MNPASALRCASVAVFALAMAANSSGAEENEAIAKRPSWTTSRIQGAPEPPAPYRLAPAFPHLQFQKPTSIEELPGAGRLLVTEMDGRIFTFPKEASVSRADLAADLRQLLPKVLSGAAISLYDAEPHPRYRENRFLFLCYVHPGDNQTRVSRFTLSDEPVPRLLPASEKLIINWPSGGHMGGCLEFGADGCLYISTGDGTGPNPPDGLTTGQDITDLLGSILRIDVDAAGEDRAYVVPPDNPFRRSARRPARNLGVRIAQPVEIRHRSAKRANSSRPTTAGSRGRWFTASSAAATAAGR